MAKTKADKTKSKPEKATSSSGVGAGQVQRPHQSVASHKLLLLKKDASGGTYRFNDQFLLKCATVFVASDAHRGGLKKTLRITLCPNNETQTASSSQSQNDHSHHIAAPTKHKKRVAAAVVCSPVKDTQPVVDEEIAEKERKLHELKEKLRKIRQQKQLAKLGHQASRNQQNMKQLTRIRKNKLMDFDDLPPTKRPRPQNKLTNEQPPIDKPQKTLTEHEPEQRKKLSAEKPKKKKLKSINGNKTDAAGVKVKSLKRQAESSSGKPPKTSKGKTLPPAKVPPGCPAPPPVCYRCSGTSMRPGRHMTKQRVVYRCTARKCRAFQHIVICDLQQWVRGTGLWVTMAWLGFFIQPFRRIYGQEGIHI